MEKISITIDVTKIPKDRIIKRSFKTKEGKEITVSELKLDIVPVKEARLIKEGDTWAMWKTHFVSIPQTKEERENNVKSLILGDGIIFKNKDTNNETNTEQQALAKHDKEILESEIPF